MNGTNSSRSFELGVETRGAYDLLVFHFLNGECACACVIVRLPVK